MYDLSQLDCNTYEIFTSICKADKILAGNSSLYLIYSNSVWNL